MSPRCRRGSAWTFQWSLGLCVRATHAWQVQNKRSDQEGHGGLRRVWVVEVSFRDASAPKTWLWKWTKDGVNTEEEPTSLKRLIPGQLSSRATGAVQTRYRESGTKGNWRSRPPTVCGTRYLTIFPSKNNNSNNKIVDTILFRTVLLSYVFNTRNDSSSTKYYRCTIWTTFKSRWSFLQTFSNKSVKDSVYLVILDYCCLCIDPLLFVYWCV